jgi:hypothetical protein
MYLYSDYSVGRRRKRLAAEVGSSERWKPEYKLQSVSRPLSRSLLMEWRVGMESLSPSIINVRLSAVRKRMVAIWKNFYSGTHQSRPPNATWGSDQEIIVAVNDNLGL